MRVMYWTLKRQKSMSSQAASISAWCAVFDWPSIVAAFSVCRHGPASSSAARRKTAARSSQGVRDQCLPGVGCGGDRAVDLGCAALVDVGEDVAALVRHDRFEGVAGPDVLAADHEWDVEPLGRELVETAPKLVALGAAGLVAEHRLVVGLRDAEDAVGAHTGDSRRGRRDGARSALLGSVAVTQVAYEVEGWGVGELVVADERVVVARAALAASGAAPRRDGRRPDPSQTPTHPGVGGSGPSYHRRRHAEIEASWRKSCRLLQAVLRRASGCRSRTVPVDLDYETPFLTRCAAALRTVPARRGRHLR